MTAGLVFAVLAAFVWGGYIFLLKRSFTSYPPAGLVVIINVFAVIWYLPVVAFNREQVLASAAGFGLAEAGIILLTSVMTAGALVLFLRALEMGDVSYVAPINKIVPVFVLPLEILLLGQILTPLQVLGVVIATLAVYVANYEPGSFFGPFLNAARSRPAQLALLSALCFAIGDLGKRIALQELGISQQLFVLLLFLVVLVVLLPLTIRDLPSVTLDALPGFAVLGAFVAAGEHLTALAFAILPASIGSPIINTQAIIAVVLGGLLLGEEHFRLRLLAAALAVTGIALLSL